MGLYVYQWISGGDRNIYFGLIAERSHKLAISRDYTYCFGYLEQIQNICFDLMPDK